MNTYVPISFIVEEDQRGLWFGFGGGWDGGLVLGLVLVVGVGGGGGGGGGVGGLDEILRSTKAYICHLQMQ